MPEYWIGQILYLSKSKNRSHR